MTVRRLLGPAVVGYLVLWGAAAVVAGWDWFLLGMLAVAGLTAMGLVVAVLAAPSDPDCEHERLDDMGVCFDCNRQCEVF